MVVAVPQPDSKLVSRCHIVDCTDKKCSCAIIIVVVAIFVVILNVMIVGVSVTPVSVRQYVSASCLCLYPCPCLYFWRWNQFALPSSIVPLCVSERRELPVCMYCNTVLYNERRRKMMSVPRTCVCLCWRLMSGTRCRTEREGTVV